MEIGRATVVILNSVITPVVITTGMSVWEQSQYNEGKAQRQKQNHNGVLKALKPVVSEVILYFGLFDLR